jgi:hypothetical protein
MKPNNKLDIYEVMDRAGLSASSILTGQEPMQKLINKIRMQIAKEVNKYIEDRENRP